MEWNNSLGMRLGSGNETRASYRVFFRVENCIKGVPGIYCETAYEISILGGFPPASFPGSLTSLAV